MAGKNNYVNVRLNLLKQNFDKNLRETKEAVREVKREFDQSSMVTRSYATESDRLTGRLDMTTQSFLEQKAGLVKLNQEYAQYMELGQENTKAGIAMRRQLEGQVHEYNRLANEMNKAQIEYEAHHSVLGRMGRGLSEFGGRMQSAGQQISGFAQHLLPTAIALGAFGKKAYDSFTAFESSLIGVQKTTNETDAVMKRFGESVRELAKETPHTAAEINRVAEIGGQLGISIQNLLPFAQTMLDLSVTTNMTLEDGAIKLAQLANVMRMPETEFRNLGSAIVDLGNNYATLEDDIVNMSHRLAGAGRVVGMTIGDILGLSTAAAQTGAKVESAGSNLSRTFLQLQMAVELSSGEMTTAQEIAAGYGLSLEDLQEALEESEEAAQELADAVGMTEDDFEMLLDLLTGNIATLQDWADAAGMSGEAFQQLFKEDAAEAFTKLIENIAALEEQGQSAAVTLDELGIKNVRQRDILLRLVGSYDKLGEAIQMGNRAYEENTALATEAELRYGSFESQVAMLKNRINDTMIEIGTRLAPVLLDMMDLVDRGIQAWDRLSDSQQEFVIKAGAFVAIGTPILFTLGRFTAGIGGLIGGLGKGSKALAEFFAKKKVGQALTVSLTKALGGSASALGGLGSAAGGASGTLGILLKSLASISAPAIGAGIAVGAAGILAYQEAIKDTIPEVDLFADHIDAVVETTKNLDSHMMGMGVSVQRTVTKISEATKEQLGGFLEYSNEINRELEKMFVVDREVTETRLETIQDLLEKEKEILLEGERTKHDERIELTRTLFEQSNVMSDEHEQAILDRLEKRKENQLSNTQYLYDSIEAIMLRAYREQRELTQEEEEEILRIKKEIQRKGLENLTDNETEKLIIQARMDEFMKRQNAETLGALLQEAQESYDRQKQAAEELYSHVVHEAAEMLKAGEITKTEYDGMVASAQQARDEVKLAAEEQMIGVLTHLQENYPDILNEINLNNGEIKSKFDMFLQSLGITRDGVDETLEDLIDKYRELAEENRRSLNKGKESVQEYRRNAGTEFDEASQYLNSHMSVIDQLNAKKIQDKSATYTIRTNYTYHHEAPTGRIPGRVSYASGVDFVPYSGLMAQLHYGERVLTRAENEKFSMASLDEVAKLVRSVQDAVKKMDEKKNRGLQNQVQERPAPQVFVNLEKVAIQNDESYRDVSYRIGREVARELGWN